MRVQAQSQQHEAPVDQIWLNSWVKPVKTQRVKTSTDFQTVGADTRQHDITRDGREIQHKCSGLQHVASLIPPVTPSAQNMCIINAGKIIQCQEKSTLDEDGVFEGRPPPPPPPSAVSGGLQQFLIKSKLGNEA